jgi:hypothetical protein
MDRTKRSRVGSTCYACRAFLVRERSKESYDAKGKTYFWSKARNGSYGDYLAYLKAPDLRGLHKNPDYLAITYEREVQRKTLEEVGRKYGLTRERIRQLTYGDPPDDFSAPFLP